MVGYMDGMDGKSDIVFSKRVEKIEKSDFIN